MQHTGLTRFLESSHTFTHHKILSGIQLRGEQTAFCVLLSLRRHDVQIIIMQKRSLYEIQYEVSRHGLTTKDISYLGRMREDDNAIGVRILVWFIRA